MRQKKFFFSFSVLPSLALSQAFAHRKRVISYRLRAGLWRQEKPKTSIAFLWTRVPLSRLLVLLLAVRVVHAASPPHTRGTASSRRRQSWPRSSTPPPPWWCSGTALPTAGRHRASSVPDALLWPHGGPSQWRCMPFRGQHTPPPPGPLGGSSQGGSCDGRAGAGSY